MFVIIKSVVEYVGVFIKIVFCVINNEGIVKFDMLVKVQVVIDEFNYKFNKVVWDLVGCDNFVFGYVYDNLNVYYIIDM